MGAGQRAAYYDLGKGRCYWWATAPVPMGINIPQAERRSYLVERFAGWPFALPELFARTAPESVLQNDIFDRPPAPAWHRGRVGLVGDAAHPTTPNLGQGACMAIEDAVVLTRSIMGAPDIEQALTRFYAIRSRRTARIIRMSRIWGRIGLWRSAPLIALRDGLFRHIPDGWFERGATDQYGYNAGALVTQNDPRATRNRCSTNACVECDWSAPSGRAGRDQLDPAGLPRHQLCNPGRRSCPPTTAPSRTSMTQ